MAVPMTLAGFVAWENRQDARYEFYGVRPVLREGGTAARAAIQVNLLAALTARLRGTRCEPFGSILKIEVAGSIRYPAAFVVCGSVPPRATVVTNPVVVFEVLGDGTANDDLVVKNAEYRATASIQRYVVLQQTYAGAIVFMRKGENWVADLVSGDDGVLRMPEVGIEVPLAECYADVALDAVTSDADG